MFFPLSEHTIDLLLLLSLSLPLSVGNIIGQRFGHAGSPLGNLHVMVGIYIVLGLNIETGVL